MKLGIASALAVGFLSACFPSNRQYAVDLQGCILQARDAGATKDERLAAYTKCADALDADGGAK